MDVNMGGIVLMMIIIICILVVNAGVFSENRCAREGMSNKASNEIEDVGRKMRDAMDRAKQAAEDAARRVREAAEAAAQRVREEAQRRAQEADAAMRAKVAEIQRAFSRKRTSIYEEKDYNIYFIQSVAGSQHKLLDGSSIAPGANNIISFTINFKGVNTGNPQSNNWNQIVGLTPDGNGGDQRYLGVWICPGSNTLHIRTETEANGNDNISDCNYPLSNGLHRIDIIGITNGDLTQTYWVYDNGNLFANPTIAGKRENAYKTPIYVFSSYNNFKHVSELGHVVSPLIVITGNGNMNPQTVVNGLNAFNDQLKYLQNV